MVCFKTSYDNLDTKESEGECIISPITNNIFFVTSTEEVGERKVTNLQMFSHGNSIQLASYQDYGTWGQGYIVNCYSGWEQYTFEEWEEKKDRLLSVLSNGMYGE